MGSIRRYRSRTHEQQIGQALRRSRLEHGLTQSQFGELIGVSYQQIQKYENGTDRIAASHIVELSNQLGVGAAKLLGLTGVKAPARKRTKKLNDRQMGEQNT